MFKKIFKDKKILFDYLLFVVLSFICLLFFSHPDIYHTGGSSYAYLKGHILDFYDYNKTIFGGNNYMPTTYIIFAIWNIPLKLVGIVDQTTTRFGAATAGIWFKLLTSVFYWATAYVFYLIGKESKCDDRTSLVFAFAFLSNPIGVYSEFIFSQYDILTAFFVSLGILFYIRNERNKFIAAFAVAITCKYFAFLFFLPLLLYKEKKIFKAILDTAKVVSLFALETLIYIRSDAFREGVFGFSASSYVFEVVWNEGHAKVSLVVIAWLALCGYTFFNEKNDFTEAIFAINIVTFISFGMSFWHPQWLLMAVPAWTLGTLMSKHFDEFIFIDIMMYTFYLVFVVNKWPEAVEESLFNMGILRDILPADKTWGFIGENSNIRDFYFIHDKLILFSSFVGVLLVYTMYKAPKFLKQINEVKIEKITGMLRLRYVYGFSLFMIPAFICLYKNFNTPNVVYKFAEDGVAATAGLDNIIIYEQNFKADIETIAGVSFQAATYDRKNNCDVHVEVLNSDKEVLTSKVVNASKLEDCLYYIMYFDNTINVNTDEDYIIRFYCENVKDDFSNSISLFTTNDTVLDDDDYLLINGEQSGKNLCMKILGDKKAQ